MDLTQHQENNIWPWWRKILFRFFFIYLLLNITPWTWLDPIPGVSFINSYYYKMIDWAVETSNEKLFHIRKVLVPMNGSGDTSYGWAQVWLFLSVSITGCIVWSVIDHKRLNYRLLNYALCLFTRYYIASIAFGYGIIKLFALQMPFPSLSQMATPLGDFLPMRFSWMFIGYSKPYEIFSGGMEVLVGVLLLYRKTSTLGALVATAVFTNVVMLNLCYDIPVKIFSIHLLMMALFLAANEYHRIVCFFVLNRPAALSSIYYYAYPKRSIRITRIILKTLFVIISIALPAYNGWKFYKQYNSSAAIKPVKEGVYDVAVYAVNKDTIPPLITDTIRWQDVIFEKSGMGSIKTSDTAFSHRYNRAYFVYSTDTVQHLLNIKKMPDDSTFILSMKYEMPDTNTIRLFGGPKADSLYVELKRNNRHFQLAEQQFHWLSEYNR